MKGNWFANVVASLALAVSLASAGWSVYAFALSAEVRVLPFSHVNFLSQAGVPQIQIDATLANLANGEFDDVAQRQTLEIAVGGRTLKFEAIGQASTSFVTPAADGSYPAPEFPCYWGGVGVLACPKEAGAVVALPAGEIVTPAVLFELTQNDCGLEPCVGVTLATLAPLLTGDAQVTYTVHTLRDGAQSLTCAMSLSKANTDYFAAVGWTNPACEAAAPADELQAVERKT